MTTPTLSKTRLHGGIWEGWLTGAPGRLEIEATHLGTPLPGVEMTPAEGGIAVRVPLPAALLSDGLQTVLLTDRETGTVLTSIAILCGDALDHDIRAEVDLMRSELDLIKRALRRDHVRAQ